MSTSQPQYPQGNFQQAPPAKSNKKLWIILGIVIGVPTVLMVGCAACVTLIGIGAANNPNFANANSAPAASASPYTASASSSSAKSNTNAAASSTPASTAGVTMANFGRLKNGMTYSQATQILGKEGTELSRNEIAGIETVMYQWDGDGWGSNMNAMFQNGKMMSKSQFGLK